MRNMIKDRQYVNIYKELLFQLSRHRLKNPSGADEATTFWRRQIPIWVSSSDVFCCQPTIDKEVCALCLLKGNAYTLSCNPVEVWEMEGRPALKFLSPSICLSCRYHQRDINRDLLKTRPSFSRMWELKIDKLIQQDFRGRYNDAFTNKFFDMFFSGCALETFCYSEEDNLLLNPMPRIQLEFRRRAERSYDGPTEPFNEYVKLLEK